MCCVPLEISGVKSAEMQGKEEVLLNVFKWQYELRSIKSTQYPTGGNAIIIKYFVRGIRIIDHH